MGKQKESIDELEEWNGEKKNLKKKVMGMRKMEKGNTFANHPLPLCQQKRTLQGSYKTPKLFHVEHSIVPRGTILFLFFVKTNVSLSKMFHMEHFFYFPQHLTIKQVFIARNVPHGTILQKDPL